MFPDPDRTAGNQIYFNVFPREAPVTQLNPNVAALGSRFQPVAVQFSAHLGIWKDCNGDGYIGHSEAGLMEYRTTLLTARVNHCASQDPRGTRIYPFNDGTWIREFIPVGPRSTSEGSTSSNPTNFYADETAVWGDWGLPRDPPRGCDTLAAPPTGSSVHECLLRPGVTAPEDLSAGRVAADHHFGFFPGNRDMSGTVRCSRSSDGTMSGSAHAVLGYCPPSDFGLALERDRGPVGAAWRTSETFVLGPQAVDPASLAPHEARFMTFYARVGPDAFVAGLQTPGYSDVYAGDVCQGNTSGEIGGWNCDASAWVARCAQEGRPEALCPRPGWQHQLRDVDCWDGVPVRGIDLRASLVDFSRGGPCEDHPANAAPPLS